MQTAQFIATFTALAFAAAAVHAYPTLSHFSGSNHIGHPEEGIDYYAHPEYKFDYAVQSPHSGDVKQQWETRNGDVVKGAYSVVESDGSLRTVHYSADKHNGFQAVVNQGGKVSTHGYGDEHGASQASGGHSVSVNHGITQAYTHGSLGLSGTGQGALGLGYGHGHGF